MADRVLLLVTDLEIGGTPTVVRELAIRLGPGVEVACLSPWGPVADQLHAAGVFVTALGARSPAELLGCTWRLIRLIRERQFDTVFSFLIHANTVAAIASLFCRDVRFLQSIQTTQPLPRWHWRLQSIVQHAAEVVVVPSPSAGEAAADWADVPREKIVVIPNAVDYPGDVDRRNVGTVRFRIGFIGRLDPVKRVGDLVQAMTLLDARFELHIYGDGADRTSIENQIDRRRLKDRVTLHGAIASPARALALIDALVLPSAAEGFGLVLIEAMAAGVPVVATNVAGIRDVVTHEKTGLLVPVASPEQLATAIMRISEDAQLRDKLTRNGTENVRSRFSFEIVLPQYRQLLNLNSADRRSSLM